MPGYASILETVGNTPVVRINHLAPDHVNLYVKVESFNPMGSVKDRLALGVIEAAEKSGELKPGQTVIEATSGNTGIGLAMVCAQKGYPLVLVMAESFSIERRKMMRFLGAKVVLTPAHLKGSGMLAKAEELAAQHGWFLTHQFVNEANADMHSRTTAPEILETFAEETLDYWVTGYGTGGTLKGTARVLKEKSPSTKIMVCEPDNSQLLGSGAAQPPEQSEGVPGSHPAFKPHLMQGWTADFIPKLTADAVDTALIDKLLPISGQEALRCTQDLAAKEGIFCGVSGGATLAGGLQVAADAPKGSNILCMLPDTGERYLSTPLFFEVPEEMSKEEQEISASTPTAQFGAPAPKKKPAAPPAPVEISDAAQAAFDEVIKKHPVVKFGMEWCEFCWSVKKMFDHIELEHHTVNLDSVTLAENDMGIQIRAALAAHTGINTIPQVFIGGEFVGGATDTFDQWKDGTLQQKLKDAGASFEATSDTDPYTFLPGWIQPR